MDYQPRLLKNGLSTLIASLAVVAVLALSGRVNAADIEHMPQPHSIGAGQ